MQLGTVGGDFTDLRARVLVSDRHPIALLLGRAPATSSGGASTRAGTSVAGPRHHTSPSLRQRAARRLGVVVDHALVELPPHRAHQIRDAGRSIARRVLR